MKPTLAAVGLCASIAVVSLASRVNGADQNPKALMQQAANALRAHRLPEALASYEKVITNSSRDAAKYKPEAMYQTLLLRVSADAAVRDMDRGAAIVDDLKRAYPMHERAQEIAAFGELFREVDLRVAAEKQNLDARFAETAARLADLTAQLNDKDAQLKASAARAEGLSAQLGAAKPQADESARARQEVASLRMEAKNLREQLAKSQAELQKKDEALKKVAGSLIKR